jgi:glycosyltransferase involved in cell wall biosynthesis
MKYINIVPTISNHSDGVGKFVKIFHQALLEDGIKARIFTQNTNDRYLVNEVDVYSPIPKFGRLQFSLALFNAVRHTIKADKNTIFHIHGLWMWVNIFPFFIKKMKYVYSPHGSISPKTVESWSFLKKCFFRTVQLRVIKKAIFLHATSQLEKNWLIDVGIEESFIKIIPLCDKISVDLLSLNDIEKSKRNSFIFVGRLAKIKNLESLIDAFQSITEEHEDANLEVIGDIRTTYARSLIQRASSSTNINFLGELPHNEVIYRLRRANHLVLPSFTENFSYSALEACYSGCSLVVSENTPWPDLTPTFIAAVFSPEDPQSIERALRKCCNDAARVFDGRNLYQFHTTEFVKSLREHLIK